MKEIQTAIAELKHALGGQNWTGRHPVNSF